MTPKHKRAEVIHISILRAAREKREQNAQTTEISGENRNLSLAWSLPKN